MTDANLRHNRIARNTLVALATQRHGSTCEVFMADVKVRLTVGGEDIFSYPDLMVCCNPADCADDYCTRPGLVIEALSENTERIDRGEKLWSYRQIDSLQAYLLLSQEEVISTLYRRESGWRAETFSDREGCAGFTRRWFEINSGGRLMKINILIYRDLKSLRRVCATS